MLRRKATIIFHSHSNLPLIRIPRTLSWMQIRTQIIINTKFKSKPQIPRICNRYIYLSTPCTEFRVCSLVQHNYTYAYSVLHQFEHSAWNCNFVLCCLFDFNFYLSILRPSKPAYPMRFIATHYVWIRGLFL